MDQQAEEVIQSLLRAVESNDIERTRTILQANEGLVNQQLDKRGTALHVACDVGNFDTCLLLLDFGANIESDNNKLKETPIFEAVKNGHVPILQLLKERGCDLNIKNKEDTGPLFYAAKFGHAAAVQILLDSGVSVNEKHQFAWTALQEACWNNHRAVAESLISSGADVNAKDRLVSRDL
jgi:ankyrin repeat protein